MADIDSERDRRVRELLSNQSKKKDQFAVMNQAQSEVGDIQSELRNHLAMEQAQDQARLQEAQTISQAAQGMMEMEGGDQLQGQVSAMNPQTQAALGKFGVKPGRTQNTSRNQASNRVVTKSGDTTNIKNENITNNHTEIKVTQPTIPMSQPTISVRPQQTKEDNTSKFKAWLSGMFAKQQNEAEIQKKEYRKKEWNLGRTTSRLMKRIEDATSGLSSKLDPKNMTSTLGGQLKWLLLIFGATMMSKFWKPTMKFLANLEGGFRAVFGLPMNNDLRQASSGTLSVIDQIKDFIGIKKGENESLIGGIGKVFMEGIDKLIDKLKFWFEDRASALKEVEFPSIETPDFGPLGKIMAPIMEGLTDTFKGLTQYIGDLITVAMGGSKGKVKVAARKISRQAQDVFTDTTGKQTSAGDSGLVKGKGRNYMKDSDYDTFGNLKSNASSTQAMSRSLVSMFNDKSGKAHTAEIGTGVGQLFDVAKRNGQVVIDPELLGYLGLTQADVIALQRNKQLRQDRYRIIGVKPTTDAQRKEMGAYTGNGGFWTGGAAGTAAGAWGGAKLGAMAGGAAASFIPGLGTAVGAGIGGTLGLIGGAFAGGYTGSALGAAGDNVVKNWTTHGLYPKLVKADSGERGADGSLGVPKMMWVLTKEGADAVTAKFTHGMTNKDMDITNKEFYDKIRKIEERKKRQNGVRGALTQNLSTNDLQVAQSNYDAYNQAYNNKFESNDPNSENMKNYGHWNSFMTNASNLMGDLGRFSASGFRSVGNWITTERLSGKQVTSRSNYLMNELMKEGLTRDQAAGVAGNIMRESGFATNKWGDHGTSTGIAQWHNERITNYNTKFGASGNLADASYEDQVRYLIWEAKQNGTLAAVKRARNYTEATNIFERKYEVSADYGSNGNRYRINYAGQALNSFNDSSGNIDTGALQTQNTSMATFYKGSSPYELNGETSSVGGSNIVAWIGDSHSELGLPGVVGSKLKAKFGCQFVWGAYHGYSACSHLKNKPYNGVCSKDNKVNNLSELLKKKPSIVIVELGTNDANGVDGGWKEGIPKLIDTIKGNGGKVIWITPFGYSVGAKNAKKNAVDLNMKQNQVRNYILSRSDISVIDAGGFINFYSGQSTPWDKFVGSDGIHWNRQGYKLLGEWIGGILTGVASNPNFSSEDLEKQDGLFGAFSKNIENVMESLAGGVEKITGNTTLSEDPFSNMTKEQKATVQKISDRNAINEALNVKSWESLGAKSDSKGTYFQNGDIRTYVRTDEGHSGIFGLREEDIDWIERVDKNGKTTKVQLTNDELMIASKSAVYSVDSLFSDYPEKTKGQGYNDFMLDKTGKPLGFYIGEFKDIESFKDPAPKDFKGKIRFWIFPTKDLKRWNMVGIGETRKCSLLIVSDTRAGERYYGPIIYHKGAHWFAPGTLKSEKKYIDYQPICYYLNVKLTPSAQIKAMELINFLNTSGNITEKNGKFYDQNGKELSDETIRQAKEYGIISKENVIGADGNYIGRRDVLRSDYKEAISQGKSLETKKFNLESYSTRLNIGSSVKDREDYYNKNKELFRTIDGVLYGPQGLKWGTVDKSGKISFYENQSFSSIVTKEGQSGLEKNLETIQNKDNEAVYKSQGFVSRETMAKFLFGASNYSREGSKITSGREVMRSINGVRNLKTTGNNDIVVPYKAYIKSDGSVYKYVVTKDHIKKALEDAGYKNAVFDFSPIEAKSLDSLDKSLITKFDKSVFKGRTNWIGTEIKTHTGNNKNRNAIDSYTRELIRKGKRISKILSEANGQTIVFEDGERYKIAEVFGFSWGKPNDETKTWINQINGAIDLKNSQLRNQAMNDSFKKSGMESLYKSFAEDANNNKMKYISAFGNYVATTGGDLFGYRDPKTGQIRALNGKEAYDAAFNYFNQEGTRENFLSNVLGLKNINGKNYYQAKNGNTTVRTQIDTSKDLSNFMSSGIDNISTGVQKFVNGKWVNITDEEEKKNALASLRKPVNEMVKNSGFTNKLIKMLNSQFGQSTSAAAKVRIKQLNTAVDQKTQQKKSNEYLKTLAEHTATLDGKFDDLDKAIKNIDTNGDSEKRANTTFATLAEDWKNKGQNLDNWTMFSGNGKTVAINLSKFRAKVNKNIDTDNSGFITGAEIKAAGGLSKIATDTATDENGKSITVINSGGNYYAYDQSRKVYARVNNTESTMSSYASE